MKECIINSKFSAYLDVLFMSGYEAIPAVCAGVAAPAGLAPLHLPHLRPRRHRHSRWGNKLSLNIFLALRINYCIVADVAHPAVVEPPTTAEPDPRLVVDVYYEVKVRSKRGLVS